MVTLFISIARKRDNDIQTHRDARANIQSKQITRSILGVYSKYGEEGIGEFSVLI